MLVNPCLEFWSCGKAIAQSYSTKRAALSVSLFMAVIPA